MPMPISTAESTPITSSDLKASRLVGDLLKRCAFSPAARRVDLAVSGGADSSALLVLAVAAGLEAHAFHVDHGLRAGSDLEARRVGELAGRLGARFTSLTAAVTDGPDLEARAREVRHGALPEGVLFGHTMDDLAETVLLRIMRGTGPGGLASMRYDRHPILGLRRSETVALCRELSIAVVDDPSNLDPRFRRNRVRHEVLPLLGDVADRDVTPLIARLAHQSAEQADLIDELARDLDASDARALAATHRVLAAVAIRHWWSDSTGDPYPPDSAAIERILGVAHGSAVSCQVHSGWVIRRTGQRLRIERDDTPEGTSR